MMGKKIMLASMLTVLQKIKVKAGGTRALARTLKTTHQNICQWKRVPVHYVLTIEKIFNIPREQQRPDIYPPGDKRR